MRERLQRLHAGAHDERERRQLDAARGRLVLQRRARGLDVGDVGFVELRDVRHVDPARVQARARDLLDATERPALDGTERSEVDDGHARQRGAGSAGRVSKRLTYALTSCSVMRPLAPVPWTLARSTPSSRAKRRIDGLACERENPGSPTTIPLAALPASSLACAGDGWMTGCNRGLAPRLHGSRPACYRPRPPQQARWPSPPRSARSRRPATPARRAAPSVRARCRRPTTARPSSPSRSRA